MSIVKKNVLVCITPQTNSKRLIDKGSQIAGEGKLHIFHMQRGNSVFDDSNAGKLLEELFDYGKTKGGMVHFLSEGDFYVSVRVFALSHKITSIVVGEPPSESMSRDDLKKRIAENLPGIEVIVLERPKDSI